MSTRAAVLTARGLQIHAGRRTIVAGIDFDLASSETVGIVGESGSGKSMTARALIGLLPPGLTAAGSVSFAGRNLLTQPERSLRGLRGRRIALLLQDPYTMLNPLLHAGTQITESLRDARGRAPRRRARREEAIRRLREVGIDDPSVADRYPFQLSGGMRQRVGLAAALASDPEILLADEPSTALDVTTQKEILALLRSLQERRGMALVLITHDLRVAFSMCERIYVLYAGSVLEVAPGTALEHEPLHPYTLGLLLSEPTLEGRLPELHGIEGSVPTPDHVAGGCPFAPRCAWVEERCTAAPTPLAASGPNRLSACIRLEEIRGELAARRTQALSFAPEPAPSQAGALVRVEGLRKTFGRSARAAVDDVTVEVATDESVGLVGESGSGKTTIARCLVGLETPTAGRIVIDGIDASRYAALGERDRRRVRQTVQMIFQDPYSSLNPVRTVGATLSEAVRLGAARRGESGSAVRELLERVGLPAGYAERKPVALSGGERQRVAIARALAVRPKLIVCDEPVSALDVSVQAQILDLFRSLREELGVSYLFITHDLAVVRQVVERIYVLRRGRVVEEGAVGAVLDSPSHAYTISLLSSVPRSEPGWLDA